MDNNKFLVLFEAQKFFDMGLQPEKNKKLKEFFSGKPVLSLEDPKLKNLKIKYPNDEPKPLLNYNSKFLFLRESILYKNLYYPLEYFDNCHKKDLEDLIPKIAMKMGVIDLKMYFNEKKISVTKIKVGFSDKLKCFFNKSKLEQVYSQKIDYMLNHSEIEKKDTGIKIDKTFVTKEDFSTWIKKENINIYGIPKLKPHIEHFQEYGNKHQHIKIKEEYSKDTEFSFKLYINFLRKIESEELKISDFGYSRDMVFENSIYYKNEINESSEIEFFF